MIPVALRPALSRKQREGYKKRSFLRALWLTRSVTRAAAQAGVSRTTPYHWRRHNPAFAQRWALILALPAPANPRAAMPVHRNALVAEAMRLLRENGGVAKCPGDRDTPSPTPLPVFRAVSTG